MNDQQVMVITGTSQGIGKYLAEYYTNREIEDISTKSQEFLETISPIHSIGRLTRIVIPEFQNLSKLFPAKPKSQIHQETVRFIEELNRFETYTSSVEGSGLGLFYGEHIKMAIVPVGITRNRMCP